MIILLEAWLWKIIPVNDNILHHTKALWYRLVFNDLVTKIFKDLSPALKDTWTLLLKEDEYASLVLPIVRILECKLYTLAFSYYVTTH